MKFLLTFFLCAFSMMAGATNYYFSSSEGNDLNNGLSPATAWKTLPKFNAIFNQRVAGDSILFKCGDTWIGSITINKAGATGNPIVIASYGTGNKPHITGFTTVSGWVHLGDNIWESTAAVSTLPTLNMVTIRGIDYAMGRYPNAGYLTYTASTSSTKTIAELNASTTNWTGAQIVHRSHHWITNPDLITGHSGTTITHAITPNATTYNGIAGYGAFIQNDARTLDQANEWYYNPSTKKLKIYNACMPRNVQVSIVDTLVWMPKVGSGNITIHNLKFSGSNMKTIVINATPNVTIQNCAFDFSGHDVIWGAQNWGAPFSPNFVFKNNTVNHTNNNVLALASEFTNALIQNNTFENTGLYPGMAKGGDGQMMVVKILADGAVIENNSINRSGYIPIYYYGNNIQIRYNFINEFNRTKMDGGGIYTYVGSGSVKTGCRVHHNIVMNSYPSTEGTNQSVGLAHAIYLDNNTDFIQVDSNVTANTSYAGIYMNIGAGNNNIFGNTCYNSDVTQLYHREASANTITNNIFFAKDAAQKVHQMNAGSATASTYFSQMGTFSNNFYARPIDDATATNTFFISSVSATVFNHWNLTTWKSSTGNDVGSVKAPKSIASTTELRFEYNATASPKVVTLDGNYIDAKNTAFNGSITLAPYAAAVLIRN